MTDTVFPPGVDVLQFLKQLVHAQDQLVDVLQRQQPLLVRPEHDALAVIDAEGQQAVEQMQCIIDKREELLTAARMQNINGSSIESLCSVCFPNNYEIRKILTEAKEKAHQIRFIAFTNWTLSQKSLANISQWFELLMQTSGQGKATYSVSPSGVKAPHTVKPQGGGVVVDRVA